MITERLTTALLGKPSDIRDRLEAALREAGAELVLVADPTTTEEREVLAAGPRNVVVLMESGVDEALDRFDALFDDPSIELLFEEASVLAARQGWDVARWGRHLAAKLRGSDEVLPAGHGDDAGFVAPHPRDALKPRAAAPAAAEPAADVSPAPFAQQHTAPEVHRPPPVYVPSEAAGDTLAFAALPQAGGFGEMALENAPAAAPRPPAPSVFEDFSAEPAVFEPASIEPLHADVHPAAAPEAFGDLAFEGDWAPTPVASTEPVAPALSDALALDGFAPSAAAPSPAPHPPADEFAFDAADFLDAAESIPDATPEPPPLHANDFADAARDVPIVDMEITPTPAAELKPMASATSMDVADVADLPPPDKWALVDFEAEQTAALNAGPGGAAAKRMDGLSALDDGTVGLDRADAEAAVAAGAVSSDADEAASRGAVVVVGGVGGPDPLRTILGLLPANFPRPVLIQQHLDAGNYDRLARQMERATALPVKLAAPGMAATGRAVYILPNSLALMATDAGLSFVEQPQTRGFADLTTTVDPADSALLVLSGAPIEVTEQALRFKVAGGWVAAQAAAGCFDHAVPALVGRGGGELDEPMALAKKITARWHS